MQHKETDLIRLVGEARTCIVRESRGKDGHFDILSPGVGLYDMPPAAGTYVTPGSFVGYLTVLRRYFHLLVPEGHHGIVTHVHVSNRKQRVEYGQPLLTVSPRAEAGLTTEFAEMDSEKVVTDDDVPDGMFGVRSPTDGIFYRRPNPQSPSYVEEGQVITQGSVLALVEVMKCFNPIVYPGEPEFPPSGKIVRIVAKDATEVKHGSVLVVVAPG
jgi:acetyl-CoA carboxylase biotin carboxyl carrier protein